MTDYFSLSLLVAGVCALLLAFGAPLLGWVFGEEFKEGSRILEVHAWSFIPYAIGIARTQYLTVENRLWVNLPSVAGALILNVVLNWFWIPTYGGLGAAWATLVSYGFAWVVSSFFLPSVGRDVGVMLSQATKQLPRFVMLLIRQAWAVR
jgi:PST family polysaccharide transporter